MAEVTEIRKSIDYSLPYVSENGERGIKRFTINFISQQIYEDFNVIVSEAYEAIQLGNDIDKYTQEIGYSVASIGTKKIENDEEAKVRLKDIRKEVKDLRTKYEDAVARLHELADHTYEKKFALVTKILHKNGVNDRDMFSLDWWKECVDMSEILRFLRTVCTKDDVESKKKLKM